MELEQKAIERLRLASDMSLTYYNQPLIITISGGKDSAVLLHLASVAKIPYEVQHSHTSVDAPETVYHVRETMRQLELQGIKGTFNYPLYKGNPVTMWTLIPQKLMPPTRLVRYCCDVLKEQAGKGRMIATGIRWAESVRRKDTRAAFERQAKKKDNIILINDNDEARRLFEDCRLKAKRVVNPIIDWSDKDIWEYIYSERIVVNPLYYEGFSRVGCVGCPLAGRRGRQIEFARFPTYERAYIRAFDKMIEERQNRGKETVWQNGMDCFRWWMEDKVLPGQILFDGF